MRLEPGHADAIREEIHRLDPSAEIYLFGSRTNDAAGGGDIDLLVVSDTLTFRHILQLRRAILDRIGWQKAKQGIVLAARRFSLAHVGGRSAVLWPGLRIEPASVRFSSDV